MNLLLGSVAAAVPFSTSATTDPASRPSEPGRKSGRSGGVAFTAIIASCGWLMSSEVSAQQIDGNELYEACRSENAVMAGFCIGYILGQVEGQSWGAFVASEQLEPSTDTQGTNETITALMGHCTPGNASNEQLRDVVLAYLSGSPETRHESARVLVWLALRDAFPCGE